MRKNELKDMKILYIKTTNKWPIILGCTLPARNQRNAWLICQMCPVWWRGERKGRPAVGDLRPMTLPKKGSTSSGLKVHAFRCHTF